MTLEQPGTPSDTLEPTSEAIHRTHDEISRAVVDLIHEEPFFGHLLVQISREVGPRLKTAGVGYRNGHPLLSVNPSFFVGTLSDRAERVAVIKHEVLHLLLDHVGRSDAARPDHRIRNLAADLVVNQLIGDWPLPRGAITCDSFEIELPPDQTMEWYYDRLREEEDGVTEGLHGEHSDHGDWDESDSVDTSAARAELAEAAKQAKARAGDTFGDAPGLVQDLVNALIAETEPSVDWRRVIRLFASTSQRTRIANTLRRPSKRFGTYPGTRVRRHRRIAVVVDTSGSVDDDRLGRFFSEIRSIWRSGAEVTVVESDLAVRRHWTYAGEAPVAIGGRGGTRFDPALEWIAAASRPFDGAIYLTDGLARPPRVDPGCPLLWVVPAGADPPALAGQRVVPMEDGRSGGAVR